MAQNGPIIILEDDAEEAEILEETLRRMQIQNQVMVFEKGESAIEFIRQTEELRRRSIPFVYLSINARREMVDQAYELTVQGFFEKADTYEGVEQQLRLILDYWRHCRHPNS